MINANGENEIVLVYSETKDNNFNRWKELAELADKSSIDHLIILDKTATKQISNYFERNKLVVTKIYLLQTDLNESLARSLMRIELDVNQWIFQIHDDDNWYGTLNHELLAGKPDVVLFEFRGTVILDPIPTRQIWPPIRIQFSLVSWQVWSNLLSFAKEQSYAIGSSIDFVLYKIANCFSQPIYSSKFGYIYQNKRWMDKELASSALRAIASIDGWGYWKSPIMPIIGRALDCFCLARSNIGQEIGFHQPQSRFAISMLRLTFSYTSQNFWRMIRIKTRGENLLLDFEPALFWTLVRLCIPYCDKLKLKAIEALKPQVSPSMIPRLDYWISQISN